ncbi:MAG: cell division protein FtsZ [Campylobacteraceae bacterium]|jgi:cell division protein FtsZ|nr:cell division protein FtsZ [Campylobacteraceae bacterium]
MGSFKIEETKHPHGAKIKVIGVGGGGGNMINHMVREGISGIDLIAANTDAQALENSLANTKIQLGEKKTKGLGAGMRPEVGKEAALENYEEIKSTLEHADIVFIASGFGGGTGTGAAPIIAQAAKEIGALTVSVVTKPFAFEGKKRAKYAEEGLSELKKESDSIVVIPNEKLLNIIDKNLGFEDSFKIVDSVLSRAVGGMSGVILSSGIINVDFADVQTVMSHRGMALLGVGESTGADAANEAVKNAIQSPLLDDVSINGALGVLVHFYSHPRDCSLSKINEAMSIIYSSADENADIIFGVTSDERVKDNFVRVTIVATGFDNKANSIEELKQNGTAIESTIRERTFDNLNTKVANGIEVDFLDTPSWLRNKMD